MFLRVSKNAPEKVVQPVANDSGFMNPVVAKIKGRVSEADAAKTSQYTELKMRMHQRLLDMINLSVIDKMPPEEFRREIGEMVRELLLEENKPLNHSEQNQLVDDILDELLGLGPIEPLLKDSGKRTLSTTMAMVRVMVAVARNKAVGPRLVPIVPDEARTFGMEGMFRQVGIYSPEGQLYKPMDADDIMPYKESQKGQMLQEGINEDGAMASWLAASTSYANNNTMMIPIYIYYSMFGFQRIGDLAWAGGDMQARGFLIGGTAGRTTLNGEGLQHQDGHSHLLAATIPNCKAYDPCYAYEMAVIVRDGLQRMYADRENLFYYITVMNENYRQPAMPDGVEEGIIRGIYLYKAAGKGKGPKVQLMGSGTILREVIAAAEMLKKDWKVIYPFQAR